jgi:hypothetical protein
VARRLELAQTAGEASAAGVLADYTIACGHEDSALATKRATIALRLGEPAYS